jgi:hypothetical protein
VKPRNRHRGRISPLRPIDHRRRTTTRRHTAYDASLRRHTQATRTTNTTTPLPATSWSARKDTTTPWIRTTDPSDREAANDAVLALLIFTQGWASAADSQANTAISQALHVSKVAENLSQALYLFGIGCGCLFVGPLSETLGRATRRIWSRRSISCSSSWARP